MNLEEQLYPQVNKLVSTNEDGHFKALILDEELDPLNCDFHGDRTVIIDTSGMQWVTLSKDNLKVLLEMIIKADKYNEQRIIHATKGTTK